MALNIEIAISAWRRPEYLQRCLGALAAMKGFKFDPAKIHVAVDADPHPDVEAILKTFSITPVMSDVKLGCNGTVKHALDMAWDKRPDAVLMIEDDIIVSHDAWLYLQYAGNLFKDRIDVRTVTLFNNIDSSFDHLRDATRIDLRNFFCCWGWLTWEREWREMRDKWTTGNDSHDTSWDVVVSQGLNGRTEVFPLLSRAYNCGEHLGTHRGSAWPGAVSTGLVDVDGVTELKWHM